MKGMTEELRPLEGAPDDGGIDWSACPMAAMFPRVENQCNGAAGRKRAAVAKRMREYQARQRRGVSR